MVMTHGRGIFPDRLIGRGIATMNTSVMLGVACMQTLSGVIVGAFPPLPDGARSEEAYRTLFGFMVLVLLLALAAYSRSTDVRPSDELRARLGGVEGPIVLATSIRACCLIFFFLIIYIPLPSPSPYDGGGNLKMSRKRRGFVLLQSSWGGGEGSIEMKEGEKIGGGGEIVGVN